MQQAQHHPSKLLEIDGLTVVYETSEKKFTAVDRVNLSVRRGEIFGLVGESGAGKSTVAAAITQLIDKPGRIAGGSIRLNDKELVGIGKPELYAMRAREIGNIFQEPLTALSPVMSVGNQLKRAIYLSTGLRHRAALMERAIGLVEAVGITHPRLWLRQYPHQLSGGMRQRLVIAMALAGEPNLIIADEPTTALDVSIQSEILQLIKRLCHKRGIGVLLITHDMAVVSEIADRVAIMYFGQVVEEGDTETVVNAPQHHYTRALISAVPRTDRKLDRFVMLGEVPDETDGAGRSDARWTVDDDPEPVSGPLVQFKRVVKRYVLEKTILRRNTKYVTALDNVSISIFPGEVFGLVGESGSGKSTIARILCGLESPDSGIIRYKGIDVTAQHGDKSLRSICADIQMVFQDPYSSLNPRHRIFDALAEPLRVHRDIGENEIEHIVIAVLRRVGLTPDAVTKFPHEFSGGQRQRLCVGRALLMRPRLLICDEPTSSLDVAIQAQILNMLKDLRDELGLTILFISHDLAVIRQMCDRIAVLKQSRICEISASESLFGSPGDPYTRQLIDCMPQFSTSFSPSH